MALDYASLIGSMANSNSQRGGGSGIGPQFKSTNTKAQNKKAGIANLLDPGNTFMGLWNNEDPQEYTGYRPYSSLRDIGEGQLYIDELKRRLNGTGVGFDPAFLSGATAPYAAAARANFANYTAPGITNAASARGLGRSTIPVNEIGLKQGEVERDIAQRIADMQYANEQQKRAEINSALSGIGEFAAADANQLLNRANFDYADFRGDQAYNFANVQLGQQNANNFLNSMTNMAGTLSKNQNNSGDNSGFFSWLLGDNDGTSTDTDNLDFLNRYLNNRSATQVNTGNYGNTVDRLTQARQLNYGG